MTRNYRVEGLGKGRMEGGRARERLKKGRKKEASLERKGRRKKMNEEEETIRKIKG